MASAWHLAAKARGLMSVKILLLGDVHLSDRAPSSCTDSYLDDLFDLLYQSTALAKELNADAVVQLGDMFHIKQPNRTSHYCVAMALEWARSSAVPIGVVPGNHDMLHDRLDSVLQTQPLGVLAKAGAIDLLTGGWAEGAFSELPVYSVPWLQEWSHTEVQRALFTYMEMGLPGLLVTHAPFFPPGQEPLYEHYLTSDFADRMGGIGSVAYGHIHDWHGVYTVNGTQFMNHGALSRGSLTESNMRRPVGVTLWDSVTGFEFIPLDYKPAEEVFLVEEVLQHRAKRADLDAFLQSVGAVDLEYSVTEDIMTHVRNLGLDVNVLKIIEALLESENA